MLTYTGIYILEFSAYFNLLITNQLKRITLFLRLGTYILMTMAFYILLCNAYLAKLTINKFKAQTSLHQFPLFSTELVDATQAPLDSPFSENVFGA